MPSRADKPLSKLIAEYLNHLTASPRTMRTYAVGLRVFLEFLLETGKKPRSSHSPAPVTLSVIHSDTLLQFQTWLAHQRYSRFSQRTYLAGVVGFMSYALSQDWFPPDFSLERARAKLKQVSRRGSYPIPRPDPSLPKLISYYDDLGLPEGSGEKPRRRRLQILRSRALVHLLYSSAGRLAEIAALDRKDVADGRRREAIVTGKGDKERYIFITVEARAAITAYVGERNDTFEPLFISHARDYGRRLSHVSLWKTVTQAARRLGMDVSPHDFRHFRARQMLEQGAPLEAIQEILGHSDISTTRRVYAHYSRPAIRAIFERTTVAPDIALRSHSEDTQE